MNPGIVPGRIGHYHVPSGEGNGYEQIALVTDVNTSRVDVNLAVFTKEAQMFPRLGVPLTGTEAAQGRASFHLNTDCEMSEER